MNVPVFVFALSVASICGVIFGVVPALRASRTPLVETLKEGGRSGSGASYRRVQRTLVVSEIALALMLSVGAGLMIRSFAQLQRVNPGFDPGHLLTFELALPITGYREDAKIRRFYDELVQRLETVPGVRSVGLTISLPPNLLQVTDNFMVEGQVLPPNQSAPVGPVVMVSDALFSTLGVRSCVVAYSTCATRSGTAVGHHQRIAREEVFFRRRSDRPPYEDRRTRTPDRSEESWLEVVGVVGDIKYSGLDAAPEPTYYMPYRQNPWNDQFVVVRAVSDPAALASAAREAVAALDKDVPVARLRTMDELMTASVAPPKFRTVLVTIFAFVGLLLAAIGIYGVMAYAVAERTHELGVRIALGADRSAVLRLVLGETVALAAIGIGVGVAGAFATTRLIQSLLFAVTPTDGLTFERDQRAARRDRAGSELCAGAPRTARRPDGRAAIRIGRVGRSGRRAGAIVRWGGQGGCGNGNSLSCDR